MTEDDLKAIEARVELANIHEDVKGPAHLTPEVRALVAEVRRLQHVADFHIKAHDLAEAKRERYRRALKDALGTLSSPIAKKILDDHGIEYAENTTETT